MKHIRLLYISVMLLFLAGCQLSASTPAAVTVSPGETLSIASTYTPTTAPTGTPTPLPTGTSTAAPTTPVPTDTPSPTEPTSLPGAQGPFQPVTYTNSILPGTITGLYASNDGEVWLVSDQGFARLEDAGWHVQLEELAGQLVWVDEAGQVWAVNEEASEISHWEAGEWNTYGEEQGWQPLSDWFAQVGSSETDSRGDLWVSTSQDVRVFKGDSWTTYTQDDMNMPPDELEDLAAELTLQVLENDEVWVGSCYWGGPGPFGGAGVRWYDGETWRGAESPVAEGCVTQIEEDDQGQVWVAVEDELWRYTPESGKWTQFQAPDPPEALRYGFATEMVVNPDGVVWIILAECGGASCFGATVPYRVQDGEWEQFAERDEMDLQRLVLDGMEGLWIIWDPGISRIEGDELTLAAELYTTRYTVDAEGNLWIVTGTEDEQLLWVTGE